MSTFFFTPCCTDSGFIQVCRIAFAYRWNRLEKGPMCLQHSWDVCIWKKYYPSSASGAPLHICLMAKWLIISGIPIQDTPRRQRTNKGLCLFQVSPPPALPTLVFHSPSYREWAPLLNPTGHLENDHLRDLSHKDLHKQHSLSSVHRWKGESSRSRHSTCHRARFPWSHTGWLVAAEACHSSRCR